ncbi:MAG: hypothetical protein ACI9YL_000639 [Luteibaculaceae bacterium]|jgi:hypothetical protein
MPVRNNYGDTNVFYLFGGPYRDGFVTVGQKSFRENGAFKLFNLFVHFYNWDFEKTGSIQNPVLDSLYVGSNIGIIEDTLYIIGKTVNYNVNLATINYSTIGKYPLSVFCG